MSKSTNPGSKSTDTGPGRFWVFGSGRVAGQAIEPLTSSYDMSLTWARADVDVLAWLLMWSDDVIR